MCLKECIWLKILLFLKSDSTPASAFFVFDFKESNFFYPYPATKFSRLFQPPRFFQLSRLLSFEEFSNPSPVYSNSPTIRHSRVGRKVVPQRSLFIWPFNNFRLLILFSYARNTRDQSKHSPYISVIETVEHLLPIDPSFVTITKPLNDKIEETFWEGLNWMWKLFEIEGQKYFKKPLIISRSSKNFICSV